MARILLIDDEEIVLKSLAVLLSSEGYEVIALRDSSEAADRIRSETFDLIISDIQMTPVSGMDLLRLARKVRPDTPVIMVSAYTSEGAMQESRDQGAVAYVRKPFRVREVLDAVRNALPNPPRPSLG
jgi:two-component system response regulator PilR (NtrC family)